MKSILAGLVLGAILSAPPVLAQDARLPAAGGEIRLEAGFTPDPLRVSVAAGGAIDVQEDASLPSACVGLIAAAPTFEVRYRSGARPLVFRARSEGDTTLIVNGPDGRWRCDDDGAGGFNPEVRFDEPQSGVYDVWVGVFGGGHAAAELIVTENP